ncbi:MAG: methenyltetrahydromethanopterin cyclohydrolase [Chloroflexi bacterium]|nr:methenyltetrahydromethanopterin cyclohydrolase [Chloroflexota bacterium]
MNRAAAAMIKDAMRRADELSIRVSRSVCGAALVDMGLECPGGWEAGRIFVEAGLGGLGRATFGTFPLVTRHSSPVTLPSINVWVDDPVIATVASQAGDWKLGDGEFAAIGSGPARAIAHQDRWSTRADYTDRADEVVVQLQTTSAPDDGLCLRVAEACGVRPENVYVVFAPTGCIVGSIQVASRTVEQVMVKLLVHGFDTRSDTVRFGFGIAPVAPVSHDEGEAMGRANDCLIYGGATMLYVDTDDESIEAVIGNLCFDVHAGELWGLPFARIFERFGRNWFQVPHLVDSPARVTINNVRTGRTFSGGQINAEVLRQSLLVGRD